MMKNAFPQSSIPSNTELFNQAWTPNQPCVKKYSQGYDLGKGLSKPFYKPCQNSPNKFGFKINQSTSTPSTKNLPQIKSSSNGISLYSRREETPAASLLSRYISEKQSGQYPLHLGMSQLRKANSKEDHFFEDRESTTAGLNTQTLSRGYIGSLKTPQQDLFMSSDLCQPKESETPHSRLRPQDLSESLLGTTSLPPCKRTARYHSSLDMQNTKLTQQGSQSEALLAGVLRQQQKQHLFNRNIRKRTKGGLPNPVENNLGTVFRRDSSLEKPFFGSQRTSGLFSKEKSPERVFSPGDSLEALNKLKSLPREKVKEQEGAYSSLSPNHKKVLPAVRKIATKFDGTDFTSMSDLGSKKFKRETLLKLNQTSQNEKQDSLAREKFQQIKLVRTGSTHLLRELSPSKAVDLAPKLHRGYKLFWGNELKENIDLSKEFKLEKTLGKGNSSIVYKGYDYLLEKIVAIKVIDKSANKQSYLRDMLQKEIDISMQLNHPHLCKLHRVLQDTNKIYLILEYCGTRTLSQMAEKYKFPEKTTQQLFRQIVSAVDYMHSRRIAHRDLKFSNILINSEGQVKIVDFGFACDGEMRQKIFCGTPSYMPPELVRKSAYQAIPVDLWCLGVIAYKLVTAAYPFGACKDKDLDKRIEEIRYKQPQSGKTPFNSLISQLLCKEPLERLSTSEILVHSWMSHH